MIDCNQEKLNPNVKAWMPSWTQILHSVNYEHHFIVLAESIQDEYHY